MAEARRYLAVVQAPEGYPPPGAPLEEAPSVPRPILHSVVLADDYDTLRKRVEALEAQRDEALRWLERMLSYSSPVALIDGVEHVQRILSGDGGSA